MITEVGDEYIILTPDDGKWLYNGDVISDKVFMPLGLDVDAWHEISDAEALEIRKHKEESD